MSGLDVRIRCQVPDGIDRVVPGLRLQKFTKRFQVVDVEFLKSEIWRLQRDADVGPLAQNHVVYAGDAMALRQQFVDQMTADKSGGAGDETMFRHDGAQ
jgi:hypothetical protein